MKLLITPSHIARGARNDCRSCPTALALEEHFTDHTVVVRSHYAYVYERTYPHSQSKQLHKFRLPSELTGAIILYDDHKQPFPPGEYELEELPTEPDYS